MANTVVQVSSEIKCPFKTRTRVQMDSFGVCHYFSAENASPAKDNASKPSPRGRGRPKGTAMVSDVNKSKRMITANTLENHNCFHLLKPRPLCNSGE